MNGVGRITLVGTAVLVAAWVATILLGREAQPAALLAIRILTTLIASGTLLWLVKSAPALEAKKSWVLHLAAVVQFLLAGIGVMFMPALALSLWDQYIDFRFYDLGFVWLLPTMAALVFCVTRRVGRPTQ
ncbi:MAG TPA: hypothetical protein VFV69_09190 [Steroidobacteraceae bacterium]|jgi:hypothetical protein|nr:hypothetical protein [Steroidobacteraceae bacterium]